MKKSILNASLLCSLVFLLFSCSKDDEIVNKPEEGKVSLSFAALLRDLSDQKTGKQQLANIPQCSLDAPAFVDVVINHQEVPVVGTFLQPLRLQIKQDGQGNFFTEENAELELEPGIYTLEYFKVLNESLEVIWVAPRGDSEGMNLANFVDAPLPLEINLMAGTKKYVDVDVLCFDNRMLNFYGYLFFDLQMNEAIMFCIFGNYCGEDGRHIEAVSYSVNVWNFSGNDAAPKGNVLYENLTNGIWISDDFENGISETGSEPVCVILPDTAGQDQYYFEINILGGVGSSAPASLIRRGVITDEDVKSLYVGNNNLDYYHFREGNCNLEDSPILFEEVTEAP